MKILYFDCFSGISGDMTLGALADLGADREAIVKALASLPVEGFEVHWETVDRNGISATRAVVTTEESHHHRHLRHILEIIGGSSLTPRARTLAETAFRRLAEAEAQVHGTSVEDVHFHEVGALDAIVDIVGASVGIDLLGPARCIASPVRVGFGTVSMAHGQYPVPAPGTANLLRGVPVFTGEFEGEWTTPTGAAILTAACEEFGPLPPMTLESVGYGAGGRTHERMPNVLRLMLGEPAVMKDEPEEVVVIETQVDDMNPQVFSHLHERLPEAGALDWFVTPVQMKKNRPGSLLTVLCRAEDRERVAALLFGETTTIGYRWHTAQREELPRESVKVTTPYGEVTVKIARRGGDVVNAAPEYEDCRRRAHEAGVPLRQVQEAAVAAWRMKNDQADSEE